MSPVLFCFSADVGGVVAYPSRSIVAACCLGLSAVASFAQAPTGQANCIQFGVCPSPQPTSQQSAIDCSKNDEASTAGKYCRSAQCFTEKARLIQELIGFEERIGTGGLSVVGAVYGDLKLGHTCDGTSSVRSQCRPEANATNNTKYKCRIEALKAPCGPDPSPDVQKKAIRVVFACGGQKQADVVVDVNSELIMACPVPLPPDWQSRLRMNDCVPKEEEKAKK